MAGAKIPVLALVTLLMVLPASAMFLEVSVDADPGATVYDLNYVEEFESVMSLNASVQNTGSVGCSYRLRTELSEPDSNETTGSYSDSAELWPGESERLSTYYISDIAQQVRADIYLDYCGETEKIERVNISAEETEPENDTEYNLTARESNVSGASVVSKELEDALLVPQEYPPYWKVGPSEMGDGETRLDYEAPIFDERENLSYKVVNKTSMEVIGNTEVDLTPEESLRDILEENLLVFLAISLILNLILITSVLRETRKK